MITKTAKTVAAIASILLLAGEIVFGATGTLMPSPYLTVFDSNGNPVSGSCIWSYTAGTSTPATTYSDSGLTTPNANPIVADSAGRFVAWLSTGSSYKFTFETACTAPSHGSVIRTVDNVLAVPGTSNPTNALETVELRLSLTSGTPVTTSDVTAATSIYVNPFRGNRIALYDGANWNMRTVTLTSIAVPSTTSTMYDVFVYDSSSTPTYETLAWTNDTTRATALTTQDGVLVKTGDATRRYLGSFRTTTVSGQTEDSFAKRFLWNYYNRVRRGLRVTDSTDNWTYTTATYRQANAATANQVAVVVGVSEVLVDLNVRALISNTVTNTFVSVGIGRDSTTTVASGCILTGIGTAIAGEFHVPSAELRDYPAVGYHFYAWLEQSEATGVTTWYGDAAGVSSLQSGLHGSVEG